jgi:hypothetical protein
MTGRVRTQGGSSDSAGTYLDSWIYAWVEANTWHPEKSAPRALFRRSDDQLLIKRSAETVARGGNWMYSSRHSTSDGSSATSKKHPIERVD